MFLRSAVDDGVKFAILSRAGKPGQQGGGGCVAKTNQAIVVGIFAKDAVNSEGMN